MRPRLKWRRGGKRSWFWFMECPCGSAHGHFMDLPQAYQAAIVHIIVKHGVTR